MKRLRYFTICVLVGACGGYDAEYDCEQATTCRDWMPQSQIDECVELTEELTSDLADEKEAQLEQLWDDCMHLEGCEYTACVTGVISSDGATMVCVVPPAGAIAVRVTPCSR